jgi:MFS family permease
MPQTQRSIWQDRDFLLFWLGRIVSTIGTILTSVVLPILVFQLTGSALQTSLLATLGVLPYWLFGLFAGVLADRVDRRTIMIVCDITNALLLASIPLAAYFHLLTITQIYLVHFLASSAFVWFDAANFGAVPSLVGRARILEANSLIWSTNTVCEIVTPSIAGILIAVLGAASTIWLDSSSYLLSAVVLLSISRALSSASRREVAAASTSLILSLRNDIGAGVSFIRHHRLVRTLTLLGFGHSVTTGAVQGMIVVFGVRALQLSSTDARLGWLFTAGAIGALLASILSPQLSKHIAVERITLFGLLTNSLAVLALVLAPNLWIGLLCYLIFQLCSTIVILNGVSLRQIVTPEHLLSRVNMSARMIAYGGTPFGAAVGGVLAEHTDIRTTYLIMAIGVSLSALLAWFSPLRVSTTRASSLAEPSV